jgi:hypothetical protein
MLGVLLEEKAQRLEEHVPRENFPLPHYSSSAVWNAQVIWLGGTVECDSVPVSVLNSLLQGKLNLSLCLTN